MGALEKACSEDRGYRRHYCKLVDFQPVEP